MSMRPAILETLDALGYATFSGAWNLNIFGVRNDVNPRANQFDDVVGVAYQDAWHGWHLEAWPATTDPGAYWLRNPGNVGGTAILKPGQYRAAYELGLHRGSYPALVQRGTVEVYRDRDRDEELEIVEASVDAGMFGINIHRASSRTGGSSSVDKWSAGCQVLQHSSHLERLVELCRVSSETYGPRFTYTLINRSSLHWGNS